MWVPIDQVSARSGWLSGKAGMLGSLEGGRFSGGRCRKAEKEHGVKVVRPRACTSILAGSPLVPMCQGPSLRGSAPPPDPFCPHPSSHDADTCPCGRHSTLTLMLVAPPRGSRSKCTPPTRAR